MDYKQEIITKVSDYIRQELLHSEPGHDWWHAVRVKNLALKIADIEGGNEFIIELASLLHDIADSKFFRGNEDLGVKNANDFLTSIKLDQKFIDEVINIIKNISFRSNMKFVSRPDSIEFKIVQDADRLDAIGAIGIARAFSYGGFKKRTFYDPQIQPLSKMTTDQYKESTAPTINHFYEKLLLLKDLMNTEAAKKIAITRHKFLELYLTQFYNEWNCIL